MLNCQRECVIVDIEEFSNENQCKPYIVCRTYLGGCYGQVWIFGGLKKNVKLLQNSIELFI